MAPRIPESGIHIEYRGATYYSSAHFDLEWFAEIVEQKPDDNHFILDEGDIDRLLDVNFGRVLLRGSKAYDEIGIEKVMDVEDLYRSRVFIPSLPDGERFSSSLEAWGAMVSRLLPKVIAEMVEELGLTDFDQRDMARSLERVEIGSEECPPAAAACVVYWGKSKEEGEGRSKSTKRYLLNTIYLVPEILLWNTENEIRGYLKHEVTHHLLRYAQYSRGNIHALKGSTWYDEGLPSFFEKKSYPSFYDPRLFFYSGAFDDLDPESLFIDNSVFKYEQAEYVFRFIEKKWGKEGLERVIAGIIEKDNIHTIIREALGMPWEEFHGQCKEYVDARMHERLNTNPELDLGIHMRLRDLHVPGISISTRLSTPLEKTLGMSTALFLRYEKKKEEDQVASSHIIFGGVSLNSPYLFWWINREFSFASPFTYRGFDVSILSAKLSFSPTILLRREDPSVDLTLGGGLDLFEIFKDSWRGKFGVEYRRQLLSGEDDWYITTSAGWQF